MSFKILLPQPILESGRQYLLDKGYDLVDGSGFEEEDIIRDIKGCDGMIVRTAKITRRKDSGGGRQLKGNRPPRSRI